MLEVREPHPAGLVRDITLDAASRAKCWALPASWAPAAPSWRGSCSGSIRAQRGAIRVQGIELGRASVAARAFSRGLAFLTEDRRDEGLCLEASIADNIALVSLRQHARPPLGACDLDAVARAVARIRAAVRLTPTARDDQPVQDP